MKVRKISVSTLVFSGAVLLSLARANAQTVPAELMTKLQKNACTACHAVDKKIVGPSFKDVAQRYKGDPGAQAKLAAKIKSGGSGSWGAIPMPPQSLKEDEAKAIAALLLQLR